MTKRTKISLIFAVISFIGLMIFSIYAISFHQKNIDEINNGFEIFNTQKKVSYEKDIADLENQIKNLNKSEEDILKKISFRRRIKVTKEYLDKEIEFRNKQLYASKKAKKDQTIISIILTMLVPIGVFFIIYF